MNPVIIIPTYWEENHAHHCLKRCYDHATPLDSETPELERCLSSLDEVRGVMRVILLVVAPHAIEDAVQARITAIARQHTRLNICIIGSREAKLVSEAIHAMVPTLAEDTISLRGYGAIKNLGLCVASIFGHDSVVFLDDDEIALDQNYLIDAVYGLNRQNRQGQTLLVKSGYYQREDGSPFADASHISWFDRHWSKKEKFNAWLSGALATTRISKSNVLCGGCMALHAEAFSQVAFDPFIARGEDLDYLINLRIYGIDTWFDNKWQVRHIPPVVKATAPRFLADAYRWIYEAQKVATSNAFSRLHPVTVASLSPYPGEWISKQVIKPITWTCRARMMGSKEKMAYAKILYHYVHDAQEYAHEKAFSYFSFMSFWPTIQSRLWNQVHLADTILESGHIVADSVALPTNSSDTDEVPAPQADEN